MVVISQPDHLPETLFILGGGKGVVKPMEEGCGRVKWERSGFRTW